MPRLRWPRPRSRSTAARTDPPTNRPRRSGSRWRTQRPSSARSTRAPRTSAPAPRQAAIRTARWRTVIGRSASARPTTCPKPATDTRDFTVDTEPPTVAPIGRRPNRPHQRPPAQLQLDGGRRRPEPAGVLARLGHPLVRGLHEPTQYDQATPLDEGSYTFRSGLRRGRQHRDRHPHLQRRPHPAHGHPHGPRPTGPTNDSRPSFGWTTTPENARECSVDQDTINFGPVHLPQPA